MKFRIVFGAMLISLASTLVATAGTKSIIATRDNTLIENATGSLSNGEGDIFVGRTGQGSGSIRRGLVYFPIAEKIPSGVMITSVTLQMRDIMGNNGDQVATLHRTLQDWGEGVSFQSGGGGAPSQQNDATWLHTFYNEANPDASPTWATPGGNFVASSSGSTTIIGNNMGLQSDVLWSSTAGMIADVQAWLDSPLSNFGWTIRGNESVGMTAKRLRAHTNNGEIVTENAPVLTITYIPEPGTMVLLAISMPAALVFGWRRRST